MKGAYIMLKNELITKKEREDLINETLNKKWYSGMKEIILKYIINTMDSDFPIFKFNIPWKVINMLAIEGDDNERIEIPSECLYLYLRSKLWNEGINLFWSCDFVRYMKVRNNEKYSDSMIMWSSSEVLDRMISRAYITKDYTDLNGVVRALEGIDEKKSNGTDEKKSTKKKNSRKKTSKPKFVSVDVAMEPETIEGLDTAVDEKINIDGATINVINNFGSDDSE
jgi:hypothetical protein